VRTTISSRAAGLQGTLVGPHLEFVELMGQIRRGGNRLEAVRVQQHDACGVDARDQFGGRRGDAVEDLGRVRGSGQRARQFARAQRNLVLWSGHQTGFLL
jgi:hypothetical protein